MTLAKNPIATLDKLGIDSRVWAAHQTITERGTHFTFAHLSPSFVLALAHLAAEGAWLINIREHHGEIRVLFRDTE